MPSYIGTMHQSDLLRIINECSSIADLSAKNIGKPRRLIKEAKWYNTANFRDRNIFARSFIPAIEIASIPLDIFWLIASFVSMGAVAIWLLAAVGLCTLFLGIFIFARNYSKKSARLQQDQEFFEISSVKLLAIDELILRINGELTRSSESSPVKPLFDLTDNIPQFNQAKHSYIPAILVGISINIVFTTTFFWGLTDTLNILGLISSSSILLGPAAIVCAAAMGAALGVFLAIKYYESTAHTQKIDELKHSITYLLQQKKSHSSFLNLTIPPKQTEKEVISPADFKNKPILKSSSSHSLALLLNSSHSDRPVTPSDAPSPRLVRENQKSLLDTDATVDPVTKPQSDSRGIKELSNNFFLLDQFLLDQKQRATPTMETHRTRRSSI